MATRTKAKGFSGLVKLKPISSWSYSRWSDYAGDNGCPRKAKFKYVDRIREPGSPAMDRGSVLHKFAELVVLQKALTYKNCVDEKGKPLCSAKDFKKFLAEWKPIQESFADEFALLVKQKASTEEQITFRSDWTETEWNDWNGAWLRIKVDAMYVEPDGTVVIIDYKTGKIRDSHRGQLSLYAIAAFLRYPEAKKVRAELWYLDQGEILDEDYISSQLEKLQKEWIKKTKAMLSDTVWKPKPGAACRFCFYRKDNAKNGGGQCEF